MAEGEALLSLLQKAQILEREIKHLHLKHVG